MPRSVPGLFVGVVVVGVALRAGATELELAVHAGGMMPTDAGEGLSRAGPIAGVTALVLANSSLAFGLELEHGQLGWHARAAEGPAQPGSVFPDDDGSMASTVLLGTGRWYLLPGSVLMPFVQIGVGYGTFVQTPQHPDCSVNAGPSAQLGLGLDGALTRWLRLGALMSAHPFALSQSCNDLAYEGRAPNPPFPGLAIAAKVALTTLWSSK